MKSHFRWVSIPNERDAKPATIAIFKRAGMCCGHPDLYFKWLDKDGITQFRYMELKSKKGKLSKNQKAWFKEFEEHKGSNEEAVVAYGYEEAIKYLEEWIEISC